MKKTGAAYFLSLLAFIIMMAHIMIPHDHHHPNEAKTHSHHHHHDSGTESHGHHHSHPVHPDHVFTKLGRPNIIIDDQDLFFPYVISSSLNETRISFLPTVVENDQPPDFLKRWCFTFSDNIFRGPPISMQS